MSKNKKITILGAGESGVGTAILAKKEGYEVFVSDFGKIKETYKQVLLHHEINWEEEGHTESKILSANIAMKSPGIPDSASIVVKLKEQGIQVISEIEFASAYTNATIIGITGSNGKTTVATMTYQILKDAKKNVSLAGNIGKSFAEQVASENFKEYVLELSSFQLDGIEKFAPHIAILTNLSPDHLDRYDDDLFKVYRFKIQDNNESNKR